MAVQTLSLLGEVLSDHSLTVKLPEGIQAGKVRVTICVEPEEVPHKMTPREFLESEFFGDLKDRDYLPKTFEEFREWRRRIWTRVGSETASSR